MKYDELLSIKVLPKQSSKFHIDNSCEINHTTYKNEVRLFSCIKEGNIKKLIEEIKHQNASSIFVGNMASNDIMQYKYMAVSSITLATRYAIQGGLNEFTAYNFSDEFIRSIDQAENTAKIMQILISGITKLTVLVQKEQKKPKHSPHINKCLKYIERNLNRRITINEIANECGISADYISLLFKNEMGEKLSSYILRQRLEAAQAMIFDGCDSINTCYSLGFSSQSYFISAFKKQFGLTPNEYALTVKRDK